MKLHKHEILTYLQNTIMVNIWSAFMLHFNLTQELNIHRTRSKFDLILYNQKWKNEVTIWINMHQRGAGRSDITLKGSHSNFGNKMKCSQLIFFEIGHK